MGGGVKLDFIWRFKFDFVFFFNIFFLFLCKFIVWVNFLLGIFGVDEVWKEKDLYIDGL